MGAKKSKVKITDEEKKLFEKSLGIRIGAELGRGVYGVVYEAVFIDVEELVKLPEKEKVELHPEPGTSAEADKEWKTESINGTKVALKLLEYDDDSREKVRNELESMDKLRHPNIVDMRSSMWFDESCRLAIVMELSPIGSLKNWLSRGAFAKISGFKSDETPVLTPEQYHNLGKGIVSGLRAVHLKAVVHRDLHMGNFLLFPDPEDPQGVIGKLADFGLSLPLVLKDLRGNDLTGVEREECVQDFMKWVNYDKMRVKEALNEIIRPTIEWFRIVEANQKREELFAELDYSLDHLWS